MRNPFSHLDPSRLVRDAEHAVAGGVQQGLHQVQGAALAGVHQLEQRTHELEGDLQKARVAIVNSAQSEALSNIGREAGNLASGLEHKVEEAAEAAVKKALTIVASKGFKEGLEKARDIVEILAPDTLGLSLGFDIASVVDIGINIQVPNPVSKISVIQKYIDSPPKGLDPIMDCVEEFAPSSLTISATSFGNGPDASWSGDSKYEKLRALLKKFGVS